MGRQPLKVTSFVSVTAAVRPGAVLVPPVEVRVRDDLVRRRRAPVALVLGRVRVTDERHVVAARERAVDRGADAGVGLRAGDDEVSDAGPGEHLLQVGGLEGVAERLLHQRFGIPARQLRDVLPGSLPCSSCSSECWTQTTGTPSSRALSTRVPMSAMTGRDVGSSTTPFWTSITRRAVLGRSDSVVTGRRRGTRPSGCREMRVGRQGSGSGGRIRTYDQAINSHPLYH